MKRRGFLKGLAALLPAAAVVKEAQAVVDPHPEKFVMGDLVHIAKDLGPSMSHFTSDCMAIVIGSYGDQYGGDDHDIYSLFLEGKGDTSWYHAHQLTLLERNRGDLRQEWQGEINLKRSAWT